MCDIKIFEHTCNADAQTRHMGFQISYKMASLRAFCNTYEHCEAALEDNDKHIMASILSRGASIN